MTPLPLSEQAVLTANALKNMAEMVDDAGDFLLSHHLREHAADLLASVEAEKVKHERA